LPTRPTSMGAYRLTGRTTWTGWTPGGMPSSSSPQSRPPPPPPVTSNADATAPPVAATPPPVATSVGENDTGENNTNEVGQAGQAGQAGKVHGLVVPVTLHPGDPGGHGQDKEGPPSEPPGGGLHGLQLRQQAPQGLPRGRPRQGENPQGDVLAMAHAGPICRKRHQEEERPRASPTARGTLVARGTTAAMPGRPSPSGPSTLTGSRRSTAPRS
jgi:hypothetical protein